jgi:hypothetical protein
LLRVWRPKQLSQDRAPEEKAIVTRRCTEERMLLRAKMCLEAREGTI